MSARKAVREGAWTPFEQLAVLGIGVGAVGIALGLTGFIFDDPPASDPTWVVVSSLGVLTGAVFSIGALILSKLEKLGAR